MTDRTSIAPSLPDKARIELNRLSVALSRCVDQARCDEIMARMREIERRMTEEGKGKRPGVIERIEARADPGAPAVSEQLYHTDTVKGRTSRRGLFAPPRTLAPTLPSTGRTSPRRSKHWRGASGVSCAIAFGST